MYNVTLNIKFLKKKDLIKSKKIFKFIKKKFKKNLSNVNFFLPRRKKKIFVLLKSPHVNKKSREYFIYDSKKIIFSCKITDFIVLFNFMIFSNKIFTLNNILFKIKVSK
jgi:ribosomal protein S10